VLGGKKKGKKGGGGKEKISENQHHDYSILISGLIGIDMEEGGGGGGGGERTASIRNLQKLLTMNINPIHYLVMPRGGEKRGGGGKGEGRCFGALLWLYSPPHGKKKKGGEMT